MTSFNSLLEKIRTARDPFEKGKPLENNTYAILRGTFEKPERIDVKYYSTRIVRYYPDGSREIHTGWTSITTVERLAEYGDVTICMMHLKAINGYRPYTDRAHFMSTYTRNRRIWVPFQAKDDYIRIDENNDIDMSTVSPIDTKCIAKPTELRRTMRHLSKCAAILRGYAKLADDERCFENGTMDMQAWLIKHVHMPLTEVELEPRPRIYVGGGSLKAMIAIEMERVRWTIAEREGWTGRCEVMEPRNG